MFKKNIEKFDPMSLSSLLQMISQGTTQADIKLEKQHDYYLSVAEYDSNYMHYQKIAQLRMKNIYR